RTCYIPSSVSRFSFLLGPAICEIYPLSLHDALPIFGLIFKRQINQHEGRAAFAVRELRIDDGRQDAGIEMMPVQADADICRREITQDSFGNRVAALARDGMPERVLMADTDAGFAREFRRPRSHRFEIGNDEVVAVYIECPHIANKFEDGGFHRRAQVIDLAIDLHHGETAPMFEITETFHVEQFFARAAG